MKITKPLTSPFFKFVILAGIGVGLYPWLFYFTKNFNFVNSWPHFWFFLSRFIVVPMLIFWALYVIRKRIPAINTYLWVFFSSFCFLLFAGIAVRGHFSIKIMAAAFIAAIVVSFLSKFIQNIPLKIIVLQLIICFTTLPDFLSIAKSYIIRGDNAWIPDYATFKEIDFKHKPNIYLIQPDGFVGIEVLKSGSYDFDLNRFETMFQQKDFHSYPKFFSNYNSTLQSNAALFAMEHHYFRAFDERQVIMGENPALSVLKNNAYQLHFVSEISYLMINRPRLFYEHTNIDMAKLSLIGRGVNKLPNLNEDLANTLENIQAPSFVFIEKISPGHITTYQEQSRGKDAEKAFYEVELKNAAEWLSHTIDQIITQDPEALIVIAADHGGFVGFEYTFQSNYLTADEQKIKGMFSALLAIRWPEQLKHLQKDPVSSVNLFRSLFSVLAEDEALLDDSAENIALNKVTEGDAKGIYQYINSNAEVEVKAID
ncbi:MAG: hypothetical protein RQ756_00795 [Flavobacteriaceae bacterium]|nr:hypothetical protein [Flavobacteriaceae bacterium]